MNKLKGKYVLACSGGPDSMALLDMAFKANVNIIVACINYHTRDTSDYDVSLVEEYCKDNKIACFVLDAKFDNSGNFENWARVIRYDFFKKLYVEYNCDGILVAHHMDDLLETYYIQKRRKITPSVYGLVYRSKMGKFNVIRPLLNYTKDDLIKYLNLNRLKYGIDDTNFEDKYLRNKIRIQVINKMSLQDKKLELKKIKKLNAEKRKIEKEYLKLIKINKEYLVSDLKKINEVLFLRLLLKKQASDKYYRDIASQIITSKICLEIENKLLISDMHKFYLTESVKDYKYIIKKIKPINKKYFALVSDGDKFHSCTVSDSDLPLTIRNYKEKDAIKMRYGTKKISRWFIDHKIPTELRKRWPIVLNCQNEIILVPKIGANLTHYSNNPNLFVLEL